MHLESPLPENVLAKARLLWGSLLLSPGILSLIAWTQFSDENASSSSISWDDPLGVSLAAAGLVCFVFAFRIHELLRPRAQKVNVAEGADSRVNAEKVLGLYLMRLALFEVLAVLGFVLSFLKSNATPMLPFVFFSLIGFVASRPTHQLLRRMGTG